MVKYFISKLIQQPGTCAKQLGRIEWMTMVDYPMFSLLYTSPISLRKVKNLCSRFIYMLLSPAPEGLVGWWFNVRTCCWRYGNSNKCAWNDNKLTKPGRLFLWLVKQETQNSTGIVLPSAHKNPSSKYALCNDSLFPMPCGSGDNNVSVVLVIAKLG